MKRLIVLLICAVLFFPLVGCGYSKDEVREFKQEAYNEGYEDGYDDGYSKGDDAGSAFGYEYGYEEGLEQGKKVQHEDAAYYVDKSRGSIEEALEIINGPLSDPDVPFDDYCDMINDALYDALAWMNKIP